MSIITSNKLAAYDYAYTRCANQEETVIIYGRACDDTLEYIATGMDSDMPSGATILEVISPYRSSVYDRIAIIADSFRQ